MGAVIGEVLPLAIGVAVSPIPVIAAILMLFSARGEHEHGVPARLDPGDRGRHGRLHGAGGHAADGRRALGRGVLGSGSASACCWCWSGSASGGAGAGSTTPRSGWPPSTSSPSQGA